VSNGELAQRVSFWDGGIALHCVNYIPFDSLSTGLGNASRLTLCEMKLLDQARVILFFYRYHHLGLPNRIDLDPVGDVADSRHSSFCNFTAGLLPFREWV
jgi:hypothetical protein